MSEQARPGLELGLLAHSTAFVLFACLVGRARRRCRLRVELFGLCWEVNLLDSSVLPEAQGGGVGTALFIELERRTCERGAAEMTLRRASNKGGRETVLRAFRIRGLGRANFPCL